MTIKSNANHRIWSELYGTHVLRWSPFTKQTLLSGNHKIEALTITFYAWMSHLCDDNTDVMMSYVHVVSGNQNDDKSAINSAHTYCQDTSLLFSLTPCPVRMTDRVFDQPPRTISKCLSTVLPGTDCNMMCASLHALTVKLIRSSHTEITLYLYW